MPRLTVEFPKAANEILEKLAKAEKTSKREIIRRALSLYNYLHEQGVNGTTKKVSITDKNDKILRDLLF